jgi:hypothetical protein
MAEYMQGSTITLTATPAAGSLFIGWTGGGCSGTGTCTVTMNGNTTVTAQFDISHARIAGTTPVYYLTLQAAYDAAPDGATVQARDLNLIENLNANRSITINLEGGYNSDYTSGAGVTFLKGMITTGAGRVTIKSFNLQK